MIHWLARFGAVLVLLAALPAGAATLNREAVVVGDQVRLGDLFAGLEPAQAATPVASAPDAGSEVRLDLDWVGRVARAYGVAWQPAPGDDGITISRASAAQQQAMADTLRSQLSGAIAAGQQASAAPAAAPAVQAPAEPLVSVPVLLRRIRSGEMILPEDIGWQNIAPDRLPGPVVTDPADLVGMTAKRMITAQQPIRPQDVRTPIVISRGEAVTMVLDSGSLQLTARGRALDDGSQGDLIRIINTDSNRTVQAVVTGPNLVTVQLGGAPG